MHPDIEVKPLSAALGAEIVYPLRDEVWGQRHFMAKDPNGLLVDVVQLIPPAPEFLREHGLADGVRWRHGAGCRSVASRRACDSR